MYTAIVLTPESKDRLWNKVSQFVPIKDWQKYCHHVTLNMGPIENGLNSKELIGKEVTFTVDAFGVSDKVLAVRVSDMGSAKSVNKVPHVTIAVDVIGGGKPFMSNKIQMWVPINEENFVGIVEQVG